MFDLAKELIKEDEGLRLKPYTCPAGKLSIGYGRNLEDRGITRAEANYLLENDLKRTLDELRQFHWFPGLSEERKAAIINLHYNIGHTKFLGFRNMITAIECGDFIGAARELLDSKYATQVPGRAGRLHDFLVRG